MSRLRTYLPVLLSALVTATLVTAGPTVARATYDAVNARMVDGRSAVGSGASRKVRAGKLVATDKDGHLPDDIIVRAPDTKLFGGKGPDAFAHADDTTLLSNRFVLVPGQTKTLLSVPGLGQLEASCQTPQEGAQVLFTNTTPTSIDFWLVSLSSSSGVYASVKPPGDVFVVAHGNRTGFNQPGDAATVALGAGITSADRRSGTVEVFVLQTAVDAPCGFQVDATVSTG